MNDSLHPKAYQPSSDVAVVFELEHENFREFISGLLGKPQTIQSVVNGVFEIRPADIENTFHLVDQRVKQQNEATLVQFTVRIEYDDNSSVDLNSLATFQTHVDVRPIASRAVHLSWTYLIRFQDKTVPEKQQIDLSFSTRGPGVIVVDDGSPLALPRIPSGNIFIRISHTARTWGRRFRGITYRTCENTIAVGIASDTVHP